MATKTKPRPAAKTSSSTRARARATQAASARPTARSATRSTSSARPSTSARPSSAKTPAAPVVVANTNELPRTPPATNEEYVLHIRHIGKRLDEHVGFMCGAEKLCGTSSEAKARALAQFYSRLFTFEHELGRIREELQLG